MEVYNYEKENKYAAPQKRELTREDLEEQYNEEHLTPAQERYAKLGPIAQRCYDEAEAASEAHKQRGVKSWVYRHGAMLAGTIAVLMGLLSLGLWLVSIEMLIPLLAALLIYAGFVSAMLVLNYEK